MQIYKKYDYLSPYLLLLLSYNQIHYLNLVFSVLLLILLVILTSRHHLIGLLLLLLSRLTSLYSVLFFAMVHLRLNELLAVTLLAVLISMDLQVLLFGTGCYFIHSHWKSKQTNNFAEKIYNSIKLQMGHVTHERQIIKYNNALAQNGSSILENNLKHFFPLEGKVASGEVTHTDNKHFFFTAVSLRSAIYFTFFPKTNFGLSSHLILLKNLFMHLNGLILSKNNRSSEDMFTVLSELYPTLVLCQPYCSPLNFVYKKSMCELSERVILLPVRCSASKPFVHLKELQRSLLLLQPLFMKKAPNVQIKFILREREQNHMVDESAYRFVSSLLSYLVHIKQVISIQIIQGARLQVLVKGRVDTLILQGISVDFFQFKKNSLYLESWIDYYKSKRSILTVFQHQSRNGISISHPLKQIDYQPVVLPSTFSKETYVLQEFKINRSLKAFKSKNVNLNSYVELHRNLFVSTICNIINNITQNQKPELNSILSQHPVQGLLFIKQNMLELFQNQQFLNVRLVNNLAAIEMEMIDIDLLLIDFSLAQPKELLMLARRILRAEKENGHYQSFKAAFRVSDGLKQAAQEAGFNVVINKLQRKTDVLSLIKAAELHRKQMI